MARVEHAHTAEACACKSELIILQLKWHSVSGSDRNPSAQHTNTGVIHGAQAAGLGPGPGACNLAAP